METQRGRSIQGNWAPTTPAKLNGPLQSPIYGDGQGGLLTQAWAEQGTSDYVSRYNNATQQNVPPTLLSSYSVNSVERNSFPSQSNHGWNRGNENPSLSVARENNDIQRWDLEEHLPNWSNQGRRSVMNYGGSSNYPRFSSWDMPLPWNDNGVSIGNGANFNGNFNDPLGEFNSLSFGQMLNGSVSLLSNGGVVSSGVFRPGWVSQPGIRRVNNNVGMRNYQDGLCGINQQINGLYGGGMPNETLPQPNWRTGMANLPPMAKHGNGSNVYASEISTSRQGIQRCGTLDNANHCSNQRPLETLLRPQWNTSTTNLPPTAKLGNGSNVYAPETPVSRQRTQTREVSENANQGSSVQNVLQEHEVDAAIADVQEQQNKTDSEPVIDSPLPGKAKITVEESPNLEQESSEDYAEINKTPMKKPRRRRYQPKVIRENKPKNTPKPKIPKPNETKDTEPRKKSVRRNKAKIPSDSTPPPPEATEPEKPTEPPVTSCKRSLNFMHEEELVGKTSMADFDLNITINQDLNEFFSLPVQENPVNSQDVKSPSSMPGKIANNYNQNDSNSAWNPNSSPCANSSEGMQTRGSKRSFSYITDQMYGDLGIGAITQSRPWQLPQTSPRSTHTEILHQSFIPEICKRKRTEIQRVHIQSTPSIATASEDLGRLGKAPSQPQVELMTSKYYNCGTAPLEINPVNNNNNNNQAVMRRSENMKQFTKTWVDLSRFQKKRTKVVTRVRDMTPLTGIASVGKQARNRNVDIARGHYSSTSAFNGVFSCTEALATEMSATPRSKRRSNQQNIVNKSWNMVLYDKSRITNEAADSMAILPWRKRNTTIEDVTMLFQQLDISKKVNVNKGRGRISSKEKAMVRYNKHDQNALVLYEKGGAIVPYEGRKRRQRARVELDDETSRVWGLLLENIDNEGIDGTDEDKATWWDNERRVFRGRVDSFIARMRLVQGDRRFTPWKGSVLDSVVGVFLTQNVSDHLSSSAFMSMAARFPLKPKSPESTPSDLTSLTSAPEVFIFEPEEIVNWDEKAMDQPNLGKSSRVIYDLDQMENVINSEHITIKARSVSPAECSSDSCQKVPDDSRAFISNSQTAETQIPYILRNDHAKEHATSPQSVTSSQNSNNSNTHVMTTSSKFSYLDSTDSFMGLLKMAGCGSQTQLQDQLDDKHVTEYYQEASGLYSSTYQLNLEDDFSLQDVKGIEMLGEDSRYSDISRKDENSPTTEQSNLTSELVEQNKSPDPFPRAAQKTSLCYFLEGETMVVDSQTREVQGAVNVIASAAQAETIPSFNGINVDPSFREIADTTESTRGLKRTKTDNKEVDQIPKQVYGSGVLPGIANINPNNISPQETADLTESTRGLERTKAHNKKVDQNPEENQASGLHSDKKTNPGKIEKRKPGKEKKNEFDWDSLRRDAQVNGKKPERPAHNKDSLDWEEVRHAKVSDIADTIKERGMNNMLAERIKDFLDRLVKDHGSTDLEWIRGIPPDKAKEYLLSFRGLGLKSVECVRLLTLHHLAFPVDTNVGRIAVRLGWVPLQPLPESLQLHLLEMYPILESIQKYLWPRLCKLDQKTLYELHYHMITFGKVFCTKRQPNCNACPLRGECRHFASAFASARFALPGPEEKSIIPSSGTTSSNEYMKANTNLLPLPASWSSNNPHSNPKICNAPTNQVQSFPLLLPFPQNVHLERKSINSKCEPIVEVPASPEQEPQHEQDLCDIEDTFYEDPNEIPTIDLNIEEFTQTLQNFMHGELPESELSNALVALKPEAASIPRPKLKNINRLRTEHYVYELPDAHPLLHGMEKREPDDPCSYLLAIWTPGETAKSIDPPTRKCGFDDPNILCGEETCSYCSSQRESDSQIIRGTLLIPTRTAMRGSFPLNGTYFQVNEVFADHASSLNPIAVPRSWLWNLPRRTVYFGTSIPTIFKGMSTEDIQHCFWRGYVCVRGFDPKTRAPRPLMARLHFPASRTTRGVKGKVYDE